MRKSLLKPKLLLVIIISMCAASITSCGSDESEMNDNNRGYFLKYKESGDRLPYVAWNMSNSSTYFILEFEEGIPIGSEWHLECSEPWIKLRSTHGKVNQQRIEKVNFTIKDNEDYDDREAVVYLDVSDGIPVDVDFSTITIHQYGYDFYFDLGQELSFDTDRSKSDGSYLKINIEDFCNVMEVDWGDGDMEVVNEKRNQKYLTHQYENNSKTYRVKLRFGGKLNNEDYSTCSFSFIINANQGITTFYDRRGYELFRFVNYATTKYIVYRDGKYTSDNC